MTNWLIAEREVTGVPLSDFKRISYEVQPCDVVLVEGRSRVSDVIKNVTQSPWTHSALYIGRRCDVENDQLGDIIDQYFNGDSHEQLIVEAMMGEGMVVYPLKKYQNEHLRLCRPKQLSHEDREHVLTYAIRQLGTPYDLRQLLDIFRFMFPYGILPRRWRSSLFQHHAGNPTRTVCSTMIAAAFHSVHYPILPVVRRMEDGVLKLFKRNNKIVTPCDFDYSPYFDIIKYPYLGFDNLAVYRSLPWNDDGVICNNENDCFVPSLSKSPEKNAVSIGDFAAHEIPALTEPAANNALEDNQDAEHKPVEAVPADHANQDQPPQEINVNDNAVNKGV